MPTYDVWGGTLPSGFREGHPPGECPGGTRPGGIYPGGNVLHTAVGSIATCMTLSKKKSISFALLRLLALSRAHVSE